MLVCVLAGYILFSAICFFISKCYIVPIIYIFIYYMYYALKLHGFLPCLVFSMIIATLFFFLLFVSADENNRHKKPGRLVERVSRFEEVQYDYMAYRKWLSQFIMLPTQDNIMYQQSKSACLDEAKLFLDLNEDRSSNSINYLVYNDVKKYLNDKEKLINSIKSGISCKNIVLLLISNAIFDRLACGQYHLYRGILTSPGNDLRILYNKAVTEMYASGYQTKKEYEEDISALTRAITNVG